MIVLPENISRIFEGTSMDNVKRTNKKMHYNGHFLKTDSEDCIFRED